LTFDTNRELAALEADWRYEGTYTPEQERDLFVILQAEEHACLGQFGTVPTDTDRELGFIHSDYAEQFRLGDKSRFSFVYVVWLTGPPN
jgi:hypothetical protein